MPGVVLFAIAVTGCTLLTALPDKTNLEDRLSVFPIDDLPLAEAVVINWNQNQIPFIEAKTDQDAAFTLGLVHAHLRLGQIELLRRISRGRLAEAVGPFVIDIDRSLRILNFPKAAESIEAAMPAETRSWLASFVAGLNHYQDRLTALPHEFQVLDIEPEPWTLTDLVAIGRLAATDVNWLFWFRLWNLRERDDWPSLWARLLDGGSASLPSFETTEVGDLADLLTGTGRPGSNAVVLSPALTTTGGAIMANDPHLGLLLPNSWLLAGYKSPSYHVVGLMIPGLPFVAVGRNPDIAWGGTNMRAASSSLYDVAGLGENAIESREEPIAVRWWFDSSVQPRESDLGPIVSDSPFLEPRDGETVALRWAGHDVSDEFTAMLAVNQARDWPAFRSAFESFAASGQNMLYADARGNIGQVMAVRLPLRNSEAPRDMILTPEEDGADWRTGLTSSDLPAAFNPARGYLVSANNKPAQTAFPVGYFYSPDDRVERLSQQIESMGPFDLTAVRNLQTDVYSRSSVELRNILLAVIEKTGAATEQAEGLIASLSEWTGDYGVESRGALVFELIFVHFMEAYYDRDYSEGERKSVFSVANLARFVTQEIDDAPVDRLKAALDEALARAAEDLVDARVWGDIHRLRLGHLLKNLPLLGNRYEFVDLPVAGSRHTVMKTSHGLTAEVHGTSYGSNARHVSDLSDPDANYFVLLGGQDGWLGSSTFLDQLEPWLAGRDIRLPLRPETVRKEFPIGMILTPENP